MAMELVYVDANEPDHVMIGAWEANGETITVAYLGTFRTATEHLGAHADAPLSLAKLLLSRFGQ